MSHEVICCSNLSRRRVAAICPIVCLDLYSLNISWNIFTQSHIDRGSSRSFSPSCTHLGIRSFPSVLHCASLRRIIYGVIRARSCTCTLKTWRICLDVEFFQLKNGYSSLTNMGNPNSFGVILIN